MENRIKSLIAVGASVTANCKPCLRRNVGKALEDGVDRQEISEAMQIGKMLRIGAASKMDSLVLSLNLGATSSESAADSKCE